MTTTAHTKLAASLLAVCLTTISIAEVTHAREATGQVQFSYRSSELATTASRAELYQRLRQVARHACRATQALDRGRPSRECRKDMESKLRAKLKQHTLALAGK